ncbi:MAG: HAMP domain-containing protein [Acidobacteria bacterium]|nr:HAMP domain-containing protein [Acidobacteriota bacterium]
MRFFSTFRGRLLVVLALLLIATLGAQYYLNLLTQAENADLREDQEAAIVAGIAVGFRGMTSQDERVADVIAQPDILDDEARRRIRDIIIIDNNWRVTDSLNEKYLPVSGDHGGVIYKQLSDLTDLPPLMEGDRLGADLTHFPNRNETGESGGQLADEAHAVPIETDQGRWYVMIILTNDKAEARWRAAKPLIYTLGVLLVSSLITFWLVWRFGAPIANLSEAARQVAKGNLHVRVPDSDRKDEIGRLATRFNEMTAELEKKQDLEQQLQQAEKSAVVGRLGSAIAHEIRNPLNYINLTLDHLRSKFAPADAEEKKKFIKMTSQLKAEVARIDGQISDFLAYSRPAKANLQPIDAHKVVQDSLRIVEPEAEEKGVRISLVEHEDVPRVLGDPEFLRSVFSNLFINALQAMEFSGGKLSVRISPSDDGRCVQFEVADTGYGIAEENLEKIFEPYFSTKETGTGLGLAIVQKVVEAHHGGSIEVESKEGEGTKFTVRLPKAD